MPLRIKTIQGSIGYDFYKLSMPSDFLVEVIIFPRRDFAFLSLVLQYFPSLFIFHFFHFSFFALPAYSLKIFKYLKPSDKDCQSVVSLQKHSWFLLGKKNF